MPRRREKTILGKTAELVSLADLRLRVGYPNARAAARAAEAELRDARRVLTQVINRLARS